MGTEPRRSLRAALSRPGLRYIYECKRRSPSAGELWGERPLAPLLDAYAGIADAVSVVTDRERFGGRPGDLAVARRLGVPVLCKAFLREPAEIEAAARHGADAVLLILAILDDDAYRRGAAAAARSGLEVLTEVHTSAELDRAIALGAPMIGINNRNLADFSIDTSTTATLAPRVPTDRLVVCESGIGSHDDVRALAPFADAFLVGTALIDAVDPAHAAREIAFGEVKICGLTRPADAAAAWRAGARWGGLVFAPGSPRRVDVTAAQSVAGASPLPLAGVFVDADPAEVGAVARAVGLAAVQLHGDEDAAAIAATRVAVPAGCWIWRALRVGDALPPIPAGIDRVIYDCTRPGSGTRFDWSLLAHAPAAGFGIAGGITPDNACAARATGAALIDVSSSVEDAPGEKSHKRITALFDAIRGCS